MRGSGPLHKGGNLSREYTKTVEGVQVPIKLYTLDEYVNLVDEAAGFGLDKQPSGADALLTAAEEAGDEGVINFVGVAVVPGHVPLPESVEGSLEIAERVIGLDEENYVVASPEEYELEGGDTFLLRRWPNDAPADIIKELEGEEESQEAG